MLPFRIQALWLILVAVYSIELRYSEATTTSSPSPSPQEAELEQQGGKKNPDEPPHVVEAGKTVDESKAQESKTSSSKRDSTSTTASTQETKSKKKKKGPKTKKPTSKPKPKTTKPPKKPPPPPLDLPVCQDSGPFVFDSTQKPKANSLSFCKEFSKMTCCNRTHTDKISRAAFPYYQVRQNSVSS